jgi:hypothetical protein
MRTAQDINRYRASKQVIIDEIMKKRKKDSLHYFEMIQTFDRIIYASCSWGIVIYPESHRTVCDCEKRTHPYSTRKKIRQFSISYATDNMLVFIYHSIHKYTCSNGIKRVLIPAEIKERRNELFKAVEKFMPKIITVVVSRYIDWT